MSVKVSLQLDALDTSPLLQRDYREDYGGNVFKIVQRFHRGVIRDFELSVQCPDVKLVFTSNSVEKLLHCLVDNKDSRRILNELLDRDME